MSKSALELLMLAQIRDAHLPEPEREYRATEGRRWRWDLAFVDQRLLIDIQGGQRQYGRHNRPAGYQNDCDKANRATLAGWRCLHFTGEQVNDGTAIQVLREALNESL